MWVRPSQFKVENFVYGEGNTMMHHFEGDYLKKTLLFTGIWVIAINWYVENEETQPGIYQKIWLGASMTIDRQNEIVYPSFVMGQNEITLTLTRYPCEIEGCLITYEVEGEPVTVMKRELLNEETAFDFCAGYWGASALEGQKLIHLALEIWQNEGGRLM